MFMEKTGMRNTARLIRIKLKNTKRSRLALCIIALLVLCSNLAAALNNIFTQEDGVTASRLQDMAVLFAIGVLVGIAVKACVYRTQNQLYSVFPQTNTSRFLSNQVIDYILILYMAVALLLIYLVEYAVVAVIAIFKSNVKIVYNFNLGFLVSGFFVLIMYAAIIMAAITLVAVLVRKFRIYAILGFGAVVALIIMLMPMAVELYGKVLGFLIFESDLAMFFLKGIALWLVMFASSFLINKHTVYYGSGGSLSIVGIVAIIAVGIAALIVMPLMLLRSVNAENENDIIYVGPIREEVPPYDRERIVLDASGLPPGATIDILAPNLTVLDFNGGVYYSGGALSMNMYLYFDMERFYEDFKDGKIVIEYQFPMPVVDYYVISPLVAPEFSARLEGNVLHLDYSYEKNVKAMFIPVWSFMWQFGAFKGRDIFKEHLGSSFGSGGLGSVFVTGG